MAELLQLNTKCEVSQDRHSVSSEQLLENALREREQLLKEHPELRAYQDEIDRTLKNVIGHKDRMAVLGFMMEAKIYQLKDSAKSIAEISRGKF